MLRCVLLTMAIAVCSVSFAQKQARSNYKLLWKISGNGLDKPSYVFGTMHVQDKKAFDFSDSVLLKLEECEAFALEVHPDSVTAFIVKTLMDRAEEDQNFQGDMSSPEFNRLDSLMKKKTGFSLRKFKNPRQANLFIKERANAKETSTFLDAWLYNLARNQNKTMLGLEEYTSQIDLMQNSEEETEELKGFLESSTASYQGAYKSLLNLYYSGDVDAIRKFSIQSTDDAGYDRLITKRNVIMSESIQNEIHRHSTFIAVGAAHLAGEEGIIHLLQQAGYQVRPVTASFTGVAAKYKIVKTEQKWFQYNSTDGGYTLSLPQKPIPFAPPQVPITFQTSVDIGTLTVYLATHLPLGSKATRENSAKMLDQFEKNMSSKGRIHSRKNISVDGYDGRELEIFQNENFFRMQLILRESVVYLLMCGPSREIARSEDANRFFTSFKTTEFPKQVAQDFVHEEGAFEIKMPGSTTTRKTTPVDPSNGRTYKINMFMSSSTETGETFIFRYNDFPPGLVSLNDSIYFSSSLKSMTESMKAVEISNHDVMVNDFPGKQFTFSMPSDPNATGEGMMVLRGNRYYLALVVKAASSPRDGVDEYFKSLRFNPYQHTTSKMLTLAEGTSLKVPVGFELDSALNPRGESTEYSFLDKNSGITYTLLSDKFSKYDQASDTLEYFDRVINYYRNETDSVNESKSFFGSGYFGKDYWINSNRVNTTRRMKVVVTGDRFYLLSAFLPKDYKQSNFSDDYFNSFTVKPSSDWNLFADKTGLIFSELKSTDSLTCEEALAAFRVHKLDSTDLPKIYEHIRYDYSDWNFEKRVKNTLLGKLSTIHDSSTLPFIIKIYSELPDSTQARDFALRALSELQTKQSVSAMVDLIQRDSSSKTFNNYMVLNPLRDSLELLEENLVKLLALDSRFQNSQTLFNLTKMALDSGVLTPATRTNVIQKVLELADKIMQEPIVKKDIEEYDAEEGKKLSLANLLVKLPVSQETKSLIMQLHKTQAVEIMAVTSIFLLENNLPVSATDLDEIAKNPEYRFDLYENLTRINKVLLMNKKYRNAKMLAESDFYQHLWYEDEYPDKVEFVEERKMVYKGKTQSLFVFKFAYEGSDEWSVGVAGPFDAKSKGAIGRGELNTLFYEDFPSAKLLTERLTSFALENDAKLIK